MQSPSVLWPLPWWTVAALALFLILFPSFFALARVRHSNECLRKLGGQLGDAGVPLNTEGFVVGEGKNVLLVQGDRIALSDLKNWRVVQILTWAQALGLKVYDQRADLIRFRIVLKGGAQTREIETHSIAGFGRLFALFGREDKSVEYIQR
jgi:hypothetical protein